MMITIHGFPAKTKYQDVKLLIKRECNLSDFILDNLVSDADGSKKVRIGLTDDSEGCILMKCLDGYRLPGNFVLKVVPVGKTPANMPPQSSFDSRPGYQNQPRNDYPNASRNDYGNQGPNDYNQGSHGSSGPHGHGGPHMPMHGPGASHGSGGLHGHGGPHGPRSSHGHGGPQGPSGSIDSVNRPSPWASGSNSNQWNPNPQLAPQMPQSSFGFNSQPTNMNSSFGQQHQQQLGHSRPETRPYNQGRAQPEQGFGFTPKSNIPEAQADPRFLDAHWNNMSNPEPEHNLPTSPHSEEDAKSPSKDGTSEHGEHEPRQDEEYDFPSGLEQNKASENTAPKKKDRKRIRKVSSYHINKLNGACRRRLFWWHKQGKTMEEAYALCKTRLKLIPEYFEAREVVKQKKKEQRIEKINSTLPQGILEKLEKLSGSVAGPEAIRVTIIDELEPMSEEKYEKLLDSILELIDQEEEDNGPSFCGAIARTSKLLLTCADLKTKEWLIKQIATLQLWEGARLRVMDPKDMPRPAIGVAHVPDPNLDEVMLIKLLETQNQGIDFTQWRVTHRKVERKGQTVTFAIGKSTLKPLMDSGSSLYIGFKKIPIRIKSKPESGPKDYWTVGGHSGRGSGRGRGNKSGYTPPVSLDRRNFKWVNPNLRAGGSGVTGGSATQANYNRGFEDIARNRDQRQSQANIAKMAANF